MPGQPLATLIVCTRNRAASLDRTLHSIHKSAQGVVDEWELVVVDNGSSDHTPAVVAAHAPHLPIRRVEEQEAGLSNARNTGVKASKGQFILWTDDDVLVHEDWLPRWFDAFRKFPDVSVFGGRATPVYQKPRQEWFIANEQALASLLALRDEPAWDAITRDRVPYGLNFAIRASEQRAHLFDPQLGVAPNRRRGGEETAVVRAILEEGGKGRWVWDAQVYHLIPPERQSARYIYQYYLNIGYQYPRFGVKRSRLSGLVASVRLLPELGVNALRYLYFRQSDHAASVPPLIACARGIASLRRHLHLRAP